MTRNLDPSTEQAITEKVAQLYVDASVEAMENLNRAMFDRDFSATQKHEARVLALDTFNKWLKAQRGLNG